MLSPAGMTGRLDRLEARGLVELRPDPDDRRSSAVVLTASGLALVDAAVADRVANEAHVIGALSPAERRTLATLLPKVLAQFEPASAAHG